MRWDRTYGQLVFVKRMTVKLKFKGRAKDESPTEHRQERVARLRVQEKGLYGVAFEEIFDGPSPFDTTSLSLTRLGEPVAFHVEPDPTIFGRGSTLYFLSEGGELNPYEQEAVYEIGVAAGEGHPMERLSRPPSGQAVDFYWERLEKEENYYYQSTLLDAPDPWLWEYLFAPQSKIFDLEVDALAPMPESSRLELWLQGGSDLPGDPDHHIRVFLNGTLLGEELWSGTKPRKLDLEILPGVLVEGVNSLLIENVGDTPADYSMVFVDRLALTYPRRVEPRSGVLSGYFPYAGVAELSGVQNVFLFDTTTTMTALVEGLEIGANSVSLPIDAGHHYDVFDLSAVRQPFVELAEAYALKRKFQ